AFLIIFGLFAMPLTAFVYLIRPLDTQPLTFNLQHSIFFFAPPALLVLGLLIGFPLLALLGLGTLAFILALRYSEQPAESFALLIVALGCAIIFGTEIIYIRDTFEGWSTRFNTIFKFYYQTWLLWGTLTPFALWYVVTQVTGVRRVISGITVVIFMLLLAGVGIYPTLVLRDLGMNELRDLNAPTPREQTEGGQAAITWLRNDATPGSVILEATEIINTQEVAVGTQAPICGGAYNSEGYAGVSAASGIPTILGWKGHEDQWRGGDPIVAAELQPRCTDVYRIYSSTNVDEARQLLNKYGVRYVYVGGLERQNYTAESLAKFSRLGTPISFGSGEVVIYELPGS
ncbi:MAG: hypothetical protein HGA19_22050, partial [Oscillochloris sp.]|nr:hypothetical protein [Oscillochloris sp.]